MPLPLQSPVARNGRHRLLRARVALSTRLGIQGKLIACFILLISLALALAGGTFASQSRSHLKETLSEQARQLSSALAYACSTPLTHHNIEELERMGQDLIKSRNMLFVAFLNEAGQAIAVASRDVDARPEQFNFRSEGTRDLMKVRTLHSATHGDYLDVVAPVFLRTTDKSKKESVTQLVGYVAVGIAQAGEEAQIQRSSRLPALIGAISTLASVPLAYLLVHRIFLPIRQFVSATDRIAAGDLDTRVAIERADVIGQLARSFNEMVGRVKAQQHALAEANQSLENANNVLEEKVHERTAQLQTANTRLSSEIAEKEDFLRAVSHDLNAPLRNISGMATMLLMKHRKRFDDDVVHRLERIQKNVEVETDLIEQLLELSRIKTRRQNMEMVELAGLIDDLAGIFENDLQQHEIKLCIDTPLPVLHCEQARLRQVFQNLIDNAIKYMGHGSVREIHIGCDVRNNETEFYVRDTGMGIEPADIEKVFCVFRRGRNAAANNIIGKGVGLASVKSIIETYSGSIWVESELGVGTTFRFTINGKFVPAGGRYTEGKFVRV